MGKAAYETIASDYTNPIISFSLNTMYQTKTKVHPSQMKTSCEAEYMTQTKMIPMPLSATVARNKN